MDALLRIQIIGGPVPWILLALSILLAAILLARRTTRRWVVTAAVAVAAGVLLAVAVWAWGNATGGFGLPLPASVLWWTAATLAGIALAIVSLWDSRWWRKVVAMVGIVVFALNGIVQVNAIFGLDPTVASLLGIVVADPIHLPPVGTDHSAPARPLYETWRAPADMPSTGKTGTAEIVGSVSGFAARPAGVYLPPAALVKGAPALPLLIFMMGYPGSPDVSRISSVLDTFAAQHHGLAPIVVVADQIGTSGDDPACADSPARGNAETYITKDVVTWARMHLNVIDDPRYWTIGGYSNGATCAIKYGALHPDVWESIASVSPELYPGTSYSEDVIAGVYDGSTARWQAAKPSVILAARKGTLDATWAVVTTGQLDTTFGPGSRTLAADMKKAGIATTLLVIPGVAHVGANLPHAQAELYPLLFARLGLAPPA